MAGPAQLSGLPVDVDVLRIALAAALGMFLGLEREWSHESAGIRTFALISLLGAVFTILGATAASVAVKAGVTLWGPNRSFTYRVAPWSAVVLTLAGGVTVSSRCKTP